MQFALDEDQQGLADALGQFLDRNSPTPGDAPTAADWARLIQEMDVAGIAVPEKFGGSGASILEQSVVMRELGRHLYGGPYAASAVMTVHTLLASDDETLQAALLPVLADGTKSGAVAGLATDARLTARRESVSWVVDGSVSHILNGAEADILLAFAQTSDGIACFVVEDLSRVTRSVTTGVDPSRDFAEVAFDSAPATPLGEQGSGERHLARSRDTVGVLLAAELLGGAERCLELAVEYAKQRVQFGRPIGSFQAIKHRLADISILVERARAASLYGAWAMSKGAPDASVAALVAQLSAVEALHEASTGAMQTFGGMGFTWDSPIHFYLRRSLAARALLEPAGQLRRRLALLESPT